MIVAAALISGGISGGATGKRCSGPDQPLQSLAEILAFIIGSVATEPHHDFLKPTYGHPMPND